MVLIKELPELQNVVESVNNTIGDGIDTDTLKDQFIDKLSESIKGLSEEQATLALSTTNLTTEQQKLVLQQAGLISGETELAATNGVLTASNVKLGTSFKLVGKAALASIKAMLTNPLTWIIIGVPIAIKLLDKLIVTQKELAESVDSLMEEYNSAITKANSYRDAVEELIPTYEKLSNGVNGLGENISLTEEEFSEYNKTVNKIADMFPDMVQGWTNEGNAIIDLKGNVDLLRESYEKTQEAAYNLLISTGKDTNGNDILKQFKNDFINHVDFGNPNAGGQVILNDAISYLNQFANMQAKDTYGLMHHRITKTNQYGQTHSYVIGDYLRNELGLKNNYSKDELIAAQKLARVKAQQYQNQIDANLSNVRTLANAYMMTDDDFRNLSSNVQNALSRVINNIDVDTALSFKAKEDVGIYVQSLIEGIKDNQDAQVALTQLFTFDASEMTIQEANSQIQSYINTLAEAFGENPIELRVKLGFEDQSQLLSNYNAVMQKAAEKFGSYQAHGGTRVYDYSWYNDFARENSINTQNEIAFWDQCIEESKTKEEAAEKYLNESKEFLSSTGFTGFTEEQSKQIDDFQSKIGSLGSTLQSLRNGEEINMTDLVQEFPELVGQTGDLDNAIVKLINGSLSDLVDKLDGVLPPKVIEDLRNYTNQMTGLYPKLSDAYSGMHNIYDVMQQVKEEFDETTGIDKFTDATLQSVAGVNERLNSMVAAWHANGVSSQELFDALKEEYQRDLENYGQALVQKNKDSEEFYNAVGMMNTDITNQFSDEYEVDISNCKSYAQARQAIETQLLDNISTGWTNFYDSQTRELNAYAKSLLAVYDTMPENIKNSVYQGGGVYKELIDSITQMEKVNAAEKALNNNIYKGIDANFSSIGGRLKDNANATSSSASEFNEVFDFFERRIEVINQALDKLDGNLENVNGSIAKNILVSGKINIVSEEIRNYTDAMTMYQQKANAELAKLNSDLQDKIRNGAVNLTQLIGESGEEVNDILTNYQNWANKVDDCNQQLIELKETLRDLALDKFNNIVQNYTDQFDLIESASNLIDKQISVFDEAGQVVGKAFYESQIKYSQEQKVLLEKEKSDLIKELSSSISSGLIQKGTDEWLEMVKSIQSVDESILDCDQSIEQLQNSILELSEKAFERLQNQFSNISSQMNNIAGLLDEIDVSSEEGIWSDEGLTRLGLAAQQYELSRHNVEKYQEQIDELNKAYSNGLYSTTEYLDKLTDLSQSQWDEANAAEEAKKNIVELNKARVEIIKTGIQKQIDKYKELTDAAKDALDKEKDLHDYEKTIAEKTKDIAKLQNQINVLQNDNSAAANAKRIKLQQELNEALDDLYETQYDHSIEEQKKALDENMEQFESERKKEIDALEEYLKNTEGVFKDSLTVIKSNTEVISEQITNIAKKHGVDISDAITNAWNSGENAIAGYNETLSSASSGFLNQIQLIELYLTALQDEADFTSTKLVGMLSAKADKLLDEFNLARDSETELVNATGMLNDSLIKLFEGGYDISGLIGQFRTIQDETQKTIDDLAKLKASEAAALAQEKADQEKAAEAAKQAAEQAYKETRAEEYKTNPNTSANHNATKEQKIIDAMSVGNGQVNADIMRAEKQTAINNIKVPFAYGSYYNQSTGVYSTAYKQLTNAARAGDGHANQLLSAIDVAIKNYKNAYDEEVKKINEKYKGYAKGVHKLNKSQLAWTQEYRSEAILSPTRNAILTKLNKGDTVLTAEQTDNLFKLSKINPDTLFGKMSIANVSRNEKPILTIGNILTVNGDITDNNIQRMENIAKSAIDSAFKKFSDGILKR